jgi:hypothetical protein
VTTRHDIVVQQNATYSQRYEYYDPTNTTPINLTGYTATAQLRATHDAATVLLTFTCTITPLTGLVVVSATAIQTAALVAPSEAVWDILLTAPGGAVERFIEGRAEITPGVTR